MKSDKLKQFVSLRDSLVKEKAALEERLAEINEALGADTGTVTAGVSRGPGRPPGGGRRVHNALSLKEAITKVTSVRPLNKQEILAGIQKIGYRFAAKNPMNSLNVILYTKGNFKNNGGKFSPLK